MSLFHLSSRVKISLSISMWRRKLLHWYHNSNTPESGAFLLVAMLVGVGAGFGAVLLQKLIDAVQFLTYDGIGGFLESVSPLHLMIIPAIGGAIAGPLVYRFAQEAKGHGVPEVMEAVALRGGRIRPQVAVIKVLASSLCIGTGGSVGREGPIAQIGSALGSTIGQWLKLSDDHVRTLVACGAAGGISATFNAPIAGSIFALEVVLSRLSSHYFGAVVISAVSADVIAHAFEGNWRTFAVPIFSLVTPWELLLYTVLGVLAAVASVSFSRLLYYMEDLWDKVPIPEYLKPMAGGLVLGILGILTFKVDGFPRVFGVGHESVNEAIFGESALYLVASLLFLKMLATMITLGSGGSGGIFAPSLFMGAMLGASFGQVVNIIFPGSTAPSGAYALVGMAAFFSGAAHAPITAILILFEMTGDYHIILPLMLATVVSTLIARMISEESIYTLKLSRRGVHLEAGAEDIDVMQGITVEEVMSKDIDTIALSMPLKQLMEEFAHTHHHGFPVINDAGELAGIVTIKDLERSLNAGLVEDRTVADIATTESLQLAYPYEPMWMALRRLGDHDIGRLPVVESPKNRKLVGLVRRIDIIRAYNKAILKKAQKQHQSELVRLDKLDGASLVEVEISANSHVAGKRVREIDLPSQSLIVSVRRGRKLRVVNGYTLLQAGDKVMVFCKQIRAPLVREYLTGRAEQKSTGKNADLQRRVRHREVLIPPGAKIIGKMIRELSLPSECILTGIQRDKEVIMPQGSTVLQAGDRVEIFGVDHELNEAEQCLVS
ncbi:MAG: chloride channel protein [SAR324 cluster bacterium]|nr:chloride channel protein [SAR324 cluster bacterium]